MKKSRASKRLTPLTKYSNINMVTFKSNAKNAVDDVHVYEIRIVTSRQLDSEFKSNKDSLASLDSLQ
jgi:hypothetical protein